MNDRAAQWKLWQENPCWDELIDMINDIKAESVSDEDRLPTIDLNIAIVAEGRGVRKGLDELLRQVEEIINSE